MATTEERLKILKMIDDGKISAEEGAKLLSALSAGQKPERKPSVRGAGGTARWGLSGTSSTGRPHTTRTSHGLAEPDRG